MSHNDHTATSVQHRCSYSFYLHFATNCSRLREMTEDMALFSTTSLHESLPVTVLECPCDISDNSSASVLMSVRGSCSHSFFVLLAWMQSICARVTANCQLPASWCSHDGCDPFPVISEFHLGRMGGVAQGLGV